MSLAFFKKDEVAIAGKTASYPSTADSGNINTRYFCPTCGSRVYGENTAWPGAVRVGTLISGTPQNDQQPLLTIRLTGDGPGPDLVPRIVRRRAATDRQ